MVGDPNYDEWKQSENTCTVENEKIACSFCGELFDEDELISRPTKETTINSVLLPSRIEYCCSQCDEEIKQYERENS